MTSENNKDPPPGGGPPAEEDTNVPTVKRRAQLGQWITPPQALFPSDAGHHAALEEAYRKGMEAALKNQASAAVAQQALFYGYPAAPCPSAVTAAAAAAGGNISSNNVAATDLMNTTTSCPNFSYAPPPIVTSMAMPPPPLPLPNQGPRSLSLPNMGSYMSRAAQEEEKRKKRLERNRASARLRRLKKKNLVDSYETEVGVLEASLQKLRSHKWGEEHNSSSVNQHEGLLDALSMDRGQQKLSVTERQTLVRDILQQQCDQVENLLESHFEMMVLGWMARDGNDEEKEQQGGEQNNDNQEENSDDLKKELDNLLQLTDDQRASLIQATEGLQSDHTSLSTIHLCLTSLQDNEYLINPFADELSEQFTSIMNPSQISKLLQWSDHNSEAIDQLDYVNAPGEGKLPSDQGPKFTFGLDENGNNE